MAELAALGVASSKVSCKSWISVRKSSRLHTGSQRRPVTLWRRLYPGPPVKGSETVLASRIRNIVGHSSRMPARQKGSFL